MFFAKIFRVVAYNTFVSLDDGLHGTGHGGISACDYHNNDVRLSIDDGLEADYGDFNVRVFNNRIVNIRHGLTAQPIKGGPVYLFRYFIYSATYSPFKLNNHTSGVLLFHNTCFKTGSCFNIVPANETVNNVWSRNNIFLGTAGRALNTTGRMRNCNFDNDGYGGYTRPFAIWNRKTFKTPEEAKAGGEIFTGTGVITIDPKTCFADGLVPPADAYKVYEPDKLNFSLAEKSDAIDKGVDLGCFSGSYKGKAPDLGALEFGEPFPQVGRRIKK